MQRMRLELVLGCAALALTTFVVSRTEAPPVHASQQSQPQAANQRAVLVELFTSEGCSSCPPADDLLRKIDGKHTDEGVLIVGVSEHVNYWDHDGWKDPFDSSTITDRQNDYGQRFHLDSVYTPQMVVNGAVQVSGNDPRALLQAIQKTGAEQGGTVKIISAKIDGNAILADISFAGDLPKRGADVFAVIAQDETTDHVTAGENEGRTLVNASVARTLVKAENIHEAGKTSVRIPLPDDLRTAPGVRRHLIVWMQEPNAGPVLGVDTQAL
jgi:hypothetical protein